MKMPQESEMSSACKVALVEAKREFPYIDSGSFAVGFYAGVVSFAAGIAGVDRSDIEAARRRDDNPEKP